MTEDKMEEGSYSVIFASLKHPIRRRILRMLADKLLTFSEILESLSIDSGHLSYHLESLGDLVAHAEDGKYQLSSIGIAAVRLMSGVEEHPPVSSRRKFKPRQLVIEVYPLILAAALILASFYCLTYATATSTATVSQDWIQPTPFSISAGQAFEFNVTITNLPSNVRAVSITPAVLTALPFGPDAYTFWVPPPTNMITTWDKESMWLELKLDMNSTPVQSGLISLPPFANLSIDVYKPDGTISTEGLKWISLIGGINRINSLHVEITQQGTYRFEIKNNDSHAWVGVLTPNVEWQLMWKPYFYYGIVGLAVALGYPILIASGFLWRFRKAKSNPKTQTDRSKNADTD